MKVCEVYILMSTYAVQQRRLELVVHQVGDPDCDVFDVVSYDGGVDCEDTE